VDLTVPPVISSSPRTFAAQWNFSYDGDGTRVAQSYVSYDSNGNPRMPVITAYFMGGLYEMSGSQVKKYYREAPRSEAERAPSPI